MVEIRTGGREAVVDLGGEIDGFLRSVGARDGLLNVWVPHATAGLAVIETGAGSDTDLLAALRDLLPADDRWRHRHGSHGHGRDHVLPALVAPSMSVPGAERADGAGHLAVDLPGRHQRRQPGAVGAAVVPAGLKFAPGFARTATEQRPAELPCGAWRDAGRPGRSSSPPPWWDEPGRRASRAAADPHPALPWPAPARPPRSGRAPRLGGRAARRPSFVARAVGASPRPAVLLAVGVLVGALVVASG